MVLRPRLRLLVATVNIPPVDSSFALAQVAGVVAQAGQLDQARQIADQALEVAQAITGDGRVVPWYVGLGGDWLLWGSLYRS